MFFWLVFLFWVTYSVSSTNYLGVPNSAPINLKLKHLFNFLHNLLFLYLKALICINQYSRYSVRVLKKLTLTLTPDTVHQHWGKKKTIKQANTKKQIKASSITLLSPFTSSTPKKELTNEWEKTKKTKRGRNVFLGYLHRCFTRSVVEIKPEHKVALPLDQELRYYPPTREAFATV